jgi:NADH:ubiquinone oxidoreductase subunit 2 (subunit N)
VYLFLDYALLCHILLMLIIAYTVPRLTVVAVVGYGYFTILKLLALGWLNAPMMMLQLLSAVFLLVYSCLQRKDETNEILLFIILAFFAFISLSEATDLLVIFLSLELQAFVAYLSLEGKT